MHLCSVLFICAHFWEMLLQPCKDLVIFHLWDEMMLESVESGVLGEPFLRSSIWYTCLRQRRKRFQVRIERRQQTAPVFQSDSFPFSLLFFLLHKNINTEWEPVRFLHRRKHQCTRSLCQSVSQVKLFRLSGVLLSSYKASVRTAGRLIVTY